MGDKMNSKTLPTGYTEFKELHMETDKKVSMIINISTIVVLVVMVLCGTLHQSFFSPFKFIDVFIFLCGLVIYVFLHETTHWILMFLFSKIKSNYVFDGTCFYAGSKGFFDKKSYVVILLSPIILLGIILIILNIFLQNWFWPIYMIQVGNVVVSITDIVLVMLLMRYKQDVLIQNDGVTTKIFSKD